jgi:hypothetical protein
VFNNKILFKFSMFPLSLLLDHFMQCQGVFCLFKLSSSSWEIFAHLTCQTFRQLKHDINRANIILAEREAHIDIVNIQFVNTKRKITLRTITTHTISDRLTSR